MPPRRKDWTRPCSFPYRLTRQIDWVRPGRAVQPLTGSSFGGGNQILVISGSAAPPLVPDSRYLSSWLWIGRCSTSGRRTGWFASASVCTVDSGSVIPVEQPVSGSPRHKVATCVRARDAEPIASRGGLIFCPPLVAALSLSFPSRDRGHDGGAQSLPSLSDPAVFFAAVRMSPSIITRLTRSSETEPTGLWVSAKQRRANSAHERRRSTIETEQGAGLQGLNETRR